MHVEIVDHDDWVAGNTRIQAISISRGRGSRLSLTRSPIEIHPGGAPLYAERGVSPTMRPA